MYHIYKQGDACVSPPSQLQMYQGRQPRRPFLKTTARLDVVVCAQERSLQYGTETMQGLEA